MERLLWDVSVTGSTPNVGLITNLLVVGFDPLRSSIYKGVTWTPKSCSLKLKSKEIKFLATHNLTMTPCVLLSQSKTCLSGLLRADSRRIGQGIMPKHPEIIVAHGGSMFSFATRVRRALQMSGHSGESMAYFARAQSSKTPEELLNYSKEMVTII
jgi:hypothetical protein